MKRSCRGVFNVRKKITKGGVTSNSADGIVSVSSSSNGVVGTCSLRSNSNITVRSVFTLGFGHYQPT